MKFLIVRDTSRIAQSCSPDLSDAPMIKATVRMPHRRHNHRKNSKPVFYGGNQKHCAIRLELNCLSQLSLLPSEEAAQNIINFWECFLFHTNVSCVNRPTTLQLTNSCTNCDHMHDQGISVAAPSMKKRTAR